MRPKKFYSYTIYLPNNLDIDKLLRENPPKFKKGPKSFTRIRDRIAYVLHLITSIPTRNKDFDFDAFFGFTPIHKLNLARRVRNYREIFDYLISNRVIIEGTRYIKGVSATGIKYTRHYLTHVRPVHITTYTLIKSITQYRSNRDIEAEDKLAFLIAWFNHDLTIDFEEALQFLELDRENARIKAIKKRARKKYTQKGLEMLPSIEDVVVMGDISKFIIIDRINSGNFKNHVFIDKTTGRMHTPLTHLMKGLRKFLRYNGVRLQCIDIVNSQPFLALIILDLEIFQRENINMLIAKYNPLFKPVNVLNKQNQLIDKPTNHSKKLVRLIKENSTKEDVVLFKNAVIAGNYYEMFAEILIERNLVPEDLLSIKDAAKRNKEIRGFAKTATFGAFFEKTQATRWSQYVTAFKECFPNVYAIFQFVKIGKRFNSHHKNIGNHRTLACILQRFESNLLLHRVCPDINKDFPGLPIFTIHDSIATTFPNAEILKTYFEKHLLEAFGVIPKLSTEEW